MEMYAWELIDNKNEHIAAFIGKWKRESLTLVVET